MMLHSYIDGFIIIGTDGEDDGRVRKNLEVDTIDSFVVKCDETIVDLGRICHTISDGSEARSTNTQKKQYVVEYASFSLVVYMHDLAHGGTEVHGCSI